MKSKYKRINFKDITKGFILAFISAFVTSCGEVCAKLLDSGSFDISWAFFKFPFIVAAIASGSYLLKNVFTNSRDQFLKPEPEIPLKNKFT